MLLLMVRASCNYGCVDLLLRSECYQADYMHVRAFASIVHILFEIRQQEQQKKGATTTASAAVLINNHSIFILSFQSARRPYSS